MFMTQDQIRDTRTWLHALREDAKDLMSVSQQLSCDEKNALHEYTQYIMRAQDAFEKVAKITNISEPFPFGPDTSMR